MKMLRIVLWCAAIYLGAWTLAYFGIMGRDFRYFASYLGLAWSGQAGELPGLMHLAALGSVAVFIVISVVRHFSRKRRRSTKPNAVMTDRA
jgi:hypothetical protein